MNIEAEKSELINWINHLKDQRIVHEFLLLKKRLELQSEASENVRDFGSGKHIFTNVSEDFNEPLDDFNEYMTK